MKLPYFQIFAKENPKRIFSFLELFFFFFLIYLFLGVLGLRFCARAFSSCGKRGPLTIAASLVAEHRLQTRRLSSCGSRVHLLRGMWDLPRPGLEPVSPALAGRFSTTAPPGKPVGALKDKILKVCGLKCIIFYINDPIYERTLKLEVPSYF